MSYDTNPYYKPEAHGLRIFDSLDTGGSYEFDMFVVWEQIESGDLYYAADAGCSCPSPFEGYSGIEDLTLIEDTKEGWASFTAALTEHSGENDADAGELAGKVSMHLAGTADKRRRGGYWSEGAMKDRIAALETQLNAATVARDDIQKRYDTLKAGVRQQQELWDMLRTMHRELDLWFNSHNDPAQVRAAFQVKA